MGLKVNEAIPFKACFKNNNGPLTGYTINVRIYDESNNLTTDTATEIGNGWYYYNLTPDAAGCWGLTFHDTISSVYYSADFTFWVEKGQEQDIETKVDTIDGFHDVPGIDVATNLQARDVIGNKSDTTGGTSLVALAKAIKSKTDNLPTDPADDSDIDGQLAVIDEFHDVPTADATANAQINEVLGNKTDTAQTTIGGTSSAIRYLKGILTELQSGTYGLSAIEVLVDDLETRLTAARAGYLDKLNISGNVAGATPLATVDGFHDIPGVDAVTNAQMRDVLGGKADSSNTTIGTTSSIMRYVKGILSELQSGTYGLSQLETLVDDLEARLTATRAGYLDQLDFDLNARLGTPAGASLAADLLVIDNFVDDLETRLSAARAGYLDNLNIGGNVAGASGLTTIDGYHDVPTADSTADAVIRDVVGRKTDTSNTTIGTTSSLMRYLKGVLTMLQNGTYGLSALETLVDGIETKTNNLPTDPADASDIAADFDRHLTVLDFWGDQDDVITLTTTLGDVNLPNVIIPTLPSGATIWKVVVLFKCATIRSTSGSDNAVLGACAIRVKKSTGSWGVDDIVAYDIPDNSWLVDTSISDIRGGDAFVGNINNDNLSGEVDGAATYNLRFENIDVDGNNLILQDVNVGLRVYIY
ncbi:MAG: hypothetical protein ACYTFW_02625 [Planctomycetota bacterium]|jgi:hypothetical protein